MGKKAIILVVALAFIALAFTGCLGSDTSGSMSKGTPASIYRLWVGEDSNNIKSYIVLDDKSGNHVSADGDLYFRVYDSGNFTLYESTDSVKASDFQSGQTIIGEDILAYVWYVPFTDMKQSQSRDSTLKAEVKFTSGSTVLSETDNYVTFPDELRSTAAPESITVNSKGIWHSGQAYDYYEGKYYVNVTLENVGTSTIDVHEYGFKVESADGAIYDGSTNYQESIPTQLQPGAKATFNVYFDLPLGAVAKTLRYEVSYSGEYISVPLT